MDAWGFSHEAPNLGHSGRIGNGDQWRAQPDADGASAGMAHGRALGQELEVDRGVMVSDGPEEKAPSGV